MQFIAETINCGRMRLRRGRVRLTARESVPSAREMRFAAREKFIVAGIGFLLYKAILEKSTFPDYEVISLP